MHISTMGFLLTALTLSQSAVAQDAKPPLATGEPPRLIIIETTTDVERSEVLRKVVEALEKEGLAQRSDEDRVGKPVDLHAEIHAQPDMSGDRILQLVEKLKSLSIGRASFVVSSQEGTNRVIITCPADVAWRRVRSIQEELEKLKDFTFDIRVAANNDPVTPTGPAATELKEEYQYFTPAPEASPPTGTDADLPVTPDSETVGSDASSDSTSGSPEFKVFWLKHAVARDIGPVIEQLLFRSERVLSLVADERTNSLIVRGDPELLVEVEVMVVALDKPSSVRGVESTSAPDEADFYVGVAEESVVNLRQEYSSLEKRTQEIAARLREPLSDSESARKLKAELQDTVRQAFTARQKLQRAELAEFARRMQSLQQSIEMRERIKKQIIDRRVEEMLDPNVNWDLPITDSSQGIVANQTPVPSDSTDSQASVPSARDPGGASKPNEDVTILSLDDKRELAIISAGSDGGMRQGTTLRVLQGRTYLGRVTVVKTNKDTSLVRIEEENSQMPIRRGDRVTAAPPTDAEEAPRSTARALAWDLLGTKLGERPAIGQYRGGLTIQELRAQGPAAKAELRVSDVLVGLDRWETKSLADLRFALEHPDVRPQPGQTNDVKVYVVRDGETVWATLTIAVPKDGDRAATPPAPETEEVDISPDGGLAATVRPAVGGRSYVLAIWDAKTGASKARSLRPGTAATVRFSANGKYVGVHKLLANEFDVFEMPTGQFIGTIHFKPSTSWAAAFEAFADEQIAGRKSEVLTDPNNDRKPPADAADAPSNSPPEVVSEWPLFRGDRQMTGAAASSLPANLALLWSFRVKDGAFEGTAAILDGVAYIGDLNGKLHALDMYTGQKKWEFVTGDELVGFNAGPAMRDGLLYIGDMNGKFYCLNADDGKPAWSFQTEAGISASPNFYKDNVLIGSQDGTLYCLNANSGELVWKHSIDDQIRCSPTVAGNRCFLAGCDSRVHIIDLDRGERVADVPIDGPTGVTPAVRGDRAYVGTENGTFYAVDWKKAEVVWKWEEGASGQGIRSSPAVTEELLVFGSRDKRLYALDRVTGKEKWSFLTRGRVDSSPVVAGTRAYFGSADGRVYGVDLTTGEKAWEYEAGGRLLGSPAVADGKLLIASDAGVVYCFGEKK